MFKEQQHPSTPGSGTGSQLTQGGERPLALIQSPQNELNLLIGAMVPAIRRSTDFKNSLFWTYGDFLEDVPRRLGLNEALDASAAVLVSAHADFCSNGLITPQTLGKYSQGLQKLRICLDHPVQASSTETLCAVMILIICQVRKFEPR